MKNRYFVALTAMVLAVGIYKSYTLKTPVDYVYRICRECRVADADVDELLVTFKGASEPRIVLMDLYRDTFDDPSQVGCETCAAAVLDAVGVRMIDGG